MDIELYFSSVVICLSVLDSKVQIHILAQSVSKYIPHNK